MNSVGVRISTSTSLAARAVALRGAVFHNAHLPYKLPRAHRAEKDGVAIEFPEYVDGHR